MANHISGIIIKNGISLVYYAGMKRTTPLKSYLTQRNKVREIKKQLFTKKK